MDKSKWYIPAEGGSVLNHHPFFALLALALSACDQGSSVFSDADPDVDAATETDVSADPAAEDPGVDTDTDIVTDSSEDPVADLPYDADYPDGMPGILSLSYTWIGCADPLPVGSPSDPMVRAIFLLEDMEDGFPVEGVQLEVFYSNSVLGPPDLDASDLAVTDVDGRVEALVPSGRRIAYRVVGGATPLIPPGTVKTSIEFDVQTPTIDDELIPAVTVSLSTFFLISTVLGITPDPSRGMLFGTLRDCAGTPVEGAVARLYTSSGIRCVSTSTCLDRYFIDNIPAADQWWTSDDGMYALLQVPPLDDYSLALHGVVSGSSCPGDLVVLGENGSAQLTVDTISIINVRCADLDDAPWSARCVF